MIKKQFKQAFMLTSLTSILIACSSGTGSSSTDNSSNIQAYQSWVQNLSQDGYNVAQGNAYLMVNSECPLYVSIFHSCFGQNPASPYIIPQPPIESSYVNPYYAESLNTPGPDGTTNIIYHLSDNDALITIVSYPPKAAYVGYQSYVFTRESSNYVGITPPRARVTSPDPSRYDIFGSLGNDVNNVIVQNQYGTAPWNGKIIVYVTTSNMLLADNIKSNATANGINPNSVFIESSGANVITGNGESADDMITLMRYAVPENETNSDTWESQLSNNVKVYKVTNTNINVERYGDTQYTPRSTNTVETNLQTALSQLATLLKNHLEAQPSIAAADSYQTVATNTENPVTFIPESGLVGAYCISNGTNCEGDNQDTSTYSTLIESNIVLGPTDTAFIAGVNHSVPSLNNNNYTSIGIYNAPDSAGVASISQTNLNAVGFDSGNLNGSAQAVLTSLNIPIPDSDVELITNIDKLYVTFLTRDCNNPTVAAASSYCINLMGTSLIPLYVPISITERSYIMPGTTTGGYSAQMVYPYIIAARVNFVGN